MQQYFGRKFDKMEKTERECEGTQEECDLMDGFILKGDIGWSVSKDEMRTVSEVIWCARKGYLWASLRNCRRNTGVCL